MQANLWHHKLFHFHFFFWVWKVWVGISREWRAFKKNIFHSFWRDIIWWKNKNLIKIQALKRLCLCRDILCLIIVLKKHWLFCKFFQCCGKFFCQEMKNWSIFDTFLIQIFKQADGFTLGYKKYNLKWNLLELDRDGRSRDINIMEQWLEWVLYYERNFI